MTEVYYVQNEKQYRKLLINLLCEADEDLTTELGIYGCDYPKECEDSDDCCASCNECACKLMEHAKDKDISEHMEIYSEYYVFPAILVMTDDELVDEKVIIVPVTEAKENTKYGYNGNW